MAFTSFEAMLQELLPPAVLFNRRAAIVFIGFAAGRCEVKY